MVGTRLVHSLLFITGLSIGTLARERITKGALGIGGLGLTSSIQVGTQVFVDSNHVDAVPEPISFTVFVPESVFQ
jgi:hypothetical protein